MYLLHRYLIRTILLSSTVTYSERGHHSTVSDSQLSLQPEIAAPSSNRHPRLTDYITNSLRETDFTSYYSKTWKMEAIYQSFNYNNQPYLMISGRCYGRYTSHCILKVNTSHTANTLV